ncbi:hypothetical protein DINM_004008 [Dirofilaria immitis]|nr:hypothetical protein [Dirofilaria immitis]
MQFLSSILLLLLAGSYFVLGQCPGSSRSLLSGYRCISSLQCHSILPGSYCYQGVCCSNGSDMVKIVSYGGYCTTTIQCSTNGAACISNICQCTAGSQYNGYSCVAVSSVCPPNHILINGQCYRKVTYGFLCNFTQQCGYIACPGNQVAIGGQCYPYARFAERCMFSEQCIDRWYQSLACINGYCNIQMDDDTIKPKCRDQRAEVEYVNGSAKNCLYWPCTVGYFCEYTESRNGGHYICCGTNANNIYGKVKVYPGTNKPLHCSIMNTCPFLDTPNCVMSHRYGYKVCCSTMNC